MEVLAEEKETKAPVTLSTAEPGIVEGGGAAESGSLPMTKTVVSSEEIEDTQDGYAEAVKNVAGVTSNNGKGTANDSIKIRGIQLNLFNSYRLNGGLPTAGVISSPIENKERVEVLKGANALMFGIASPGGIVNLVTKRAGEQTVATGTFSGNSFGQYGGTVDLGQRFGSEKQVGVRVNASATHYENGVDGASGNGKFASVGADWKVTRDLKLSLDYEHYTRHVVEQGLINVLKPVNGVIAVPRVPDPTRLLSGPWAVYSPRTDNYQVRLDYKLAKNWNIMAEGGQSRSERSRFTTRVGNYDVVTGNGTATTTIVQDQRYVNTFYRAEIDGRFSTGIFKHDLTVGVASSERYANQPVATAVAVGRQNIYNPSPLPAPRMPGGPLTYTPQDSRDIGVYVYDAIQLHRQWKLLTGVRETFYEATNTAANGSRTTERSRTRSPAVGLLYDVLPGTTVYASYMKGLEETGSAPVGTVNQYQILPPASATQVEVGLRTAVGGFNGNVALFDITRANAVVDPLLNVFRLDGTNKFRGAEVTANLDLSRHWALNAAGQYLQAEQNPQFNHSLSGKVPENTPTFTGNFSVTHRPAWLAGLSFNAGVSYVGSRYVNALNQAQIPGVTLFTAGVGYATKIAGRRVSLQFSADNLANKRYWNSVSSGTYGAGMVRSFRFNAKVEF